MKTLALLSIWLALPLAAQSGGDAFAGCEPLPGGGCHAVAPRSQGLTTKLTPEEHDPYVLMVLQEYMYRAIAAEKLMTGTAGYQDLLNRDHSRQERMDALKQLVAKHNACDGGDWNISKKEWICPTKTGASQ